MNPLGFRTSFGYDAASRQVSVTDALGNISTTVFDADGRTLATINANGFATTQVYRRDRRVAGRRSTRGGTGTASPTTPLAGKSGMSDPLGNLITYQFDAASRQTLRIDGRGLRTSYSYDAASRLTGQQYQNGTRVTNTYDANSQRTVLSDWTGAYTSTYDPDGRLSSVVNPAGLAITYGYDAASQRAAAESADRPLSPTSTTRRADQHLDQSRGAGHELAVYDAASRVKAMLMANGTLASNTLMTMRTNCCCWPTSPRAEQTLSSFNYTYNPVGNRTQVVEANGDVVTLAYDPTYQLTNEQRSGANAYNISYTYDPVGNRTLLLNGGAVTTTSTTPGTSW